MSAGRTRASHVPICACLLLKLQNPSDKINKVSGFTICRNTCNQAHFFLLIRACEQGQLFQYCLHVSLYKSGLGSDKHVCVFYLCMHIYLVFFYFQVLPVRARPTSMSHTPQGDIIGDGIATAATYNYTSTS